jgi:hydrogenase nickel incorporation protein HypA/HybF
MHELGIVMNIVKQMEDYKVEHDLQKIEKLVLQVGALSGVVPKYLEDVYPMAVLDTSLQDTELVIEETPGIGLCNQCGFRYDLTHNDNTCPSCQSDDFSIISGKEFLIKELHAI